MRKGRQRTVRLSARAVKYIDAYRGENFSEKLENFVLDTEERRELLTLDWERLQAEITDKRAELKALQERVRKLREEDRRPDLLGQRGGDRDRRMDG